jgi:RimJ/RimL family protein N-acetyltransferase
MRVRLRELTEVDAAISFRWRNDPDVWKLTGRKWNSYVTEETEREWIKQSLNSDSVKRMAICVGSDDKYIGNVQLTEILNGKAVFHIFIGEKQFWGMGIGKTATKLMIDYAKDELGLEELSLVVFETNKPAIKIYKSIGFFKVSKNGVKILMNRKL